MCDIYNVSVTSNFPLTKIFLDTSPSVKILLFLLFTFYDFIDVHFHIYFALCKRCFLLPKLTKRDMGWRGCDKKSDITHSDFVYAQFSCFSVFPSVISKWVVIVLP